MRDVRYLRGVHLGTNIFGLVFMPLMYWITALQVTQALARFRDAVPGYNTVKHLSYISVFLNFISYVMLIAFVSIYDGNYRYRK